MFEFKYECELESYLVDNWGKYYDFPLVGRQFYLKSGCKVDLIGADNYNIYIIEVRRSYINQNALNNLIRYIDGLKIKNKAIVGVLIGTRISENFKLQLNGMKSIEHLVLEDVVFNKKLLRENYKSHKKLPNMWGKLSFGEI